MVARQRPIRALLVEDDPGEAMLIRGALDESRWPFEIVEADRLAQAIEVASAQHPDVVLLDLGLPDSSGEATLQAFRAARPRVPVVVLTGLDDDLSADRALLAGAQDYLVKGGSLGDTVARAIRNAIERSRLAMQIDRHHQQRGALVELGRIALSGADHRTLADAAAEQVARALAVRSAAVVDHDVDRDRLVLVGSYCQDTCGADRTEMRADRTTLPGLTVTTRQPVLVQDATTGREPGSDLGLCRCSTGSGVCVPVQDGDLALGAVAAAAAEPGHFDRGDVEFLEAVANLLAEASRRRRAVREARDREAFVSSLLTQIPGMTWTTDLDLRLRSLRGTRLTQIGLAEADVAGLHITEFVTPAARSVALGAHHAALGGEPTSYRYEVEDSVWQARVEPLRGPTGKVEGVIGSSIDVTDAERTRRELHRNQQRLASLIEHAPDVILVLDRGANVTYASPSIGRVSDWSPEEFVGLDVWELLPPDEVAAGRAFWEQVVATRGTIGPIVIRLRILGRGDCYMEAVYTNRLDDPAVRGVIVNLRDVTDQRLAEHSLRDSEARFRRLADNAPDIVFRMSLDPMARVEYVSPAVERVTGYTVQECYDEPDLAFRMLDPADHELVAATRDGRPPEGPVQLQLYRKDGARTWAEVRFVAVTDDRGEIVGVEGIARDISQSKLAEETLRGALTREQQAARDLRALDAMKNGFLQAVSHELRTPLTAVVGFSALLENRDRLDDARYHQLVTRLRANAARLERLLTDLLDVDRMTRNTLEPQRAPTDVRDLVSRVAEDLIEEGFLVRVHGESTVASIDPAKTERIVENLLRNAAKHAPGDLVEVFVDRTGAGILLAVEDRGPGVPETLKGAVFEPFRQGDTDASKVGGLGIGLSVVQTFATLHGGRAWVEDRPGGGASFRVLLPEGDAPAAPSPEAVAAVAAARVELMGSEPTASSLRTRGPLTLPR